MNKKISIGALVGLLLAAAPFAVSLASAQTTSTATTTATAVTSTVVSSQVTIAQLQAQILQLTKQITVLAKRITSLRIAKDINTASQFNARANTVRASTNSRVQKLMQQMQLGSRGEGVTMLQKLLSTDSTIYPSKLVTGYYGRLTEDAVRAFQKKNGIEDVGEVGPKTRAVLNAYLSHASSTMPSNLLREFEKEGAVRGSQASVSVCQKNSQSGTSQTIAIAQSAMLSHIERGDSIGSCSSEGEQSQKPESEGMNNSFKSNTPSIQSTFFGEGSGRGN